MVAPSKTVRRAIVSLNLHPTRVPALVIFAQHVLKSMTGNVWFPSPTPPLAVVGQATSELQDAENAALGRARGAVAARDEKRIALVMQLRFLAAYVQNVADANVENSASIIQSAGLALRKVPVQPPRVFTAKLGANSGTVVIIAPSAGPRSSYEWQKSTDGGATWSDLPATLQAKTTASGFARTSTPAFRYRTVTKSGQGDWSAPVTVMVM